MTQDLIDWIKTTPWLTADATVRVPPDVLRELVAEVEATRAKVREYEEAEKSATRFGAVAAAFAAPRPRAG